MKKSVWKNHPFWEGGGLEWSDSFSMNLPEIVLIALLHHGDEDHEEEGPQPGDGVDGGVDQH